MSNIMHQLFNMVSENLSVEPPVEYLEKRKSLARARLTLVDELERLCGEEGISLLNSIALLEGESEELREQALFEAGVELGLTLGRLS